MLSIRPEEPEDYEASLLRISGALHLSIFEQPTKYDFFRNLPKRAEESEES